MGLQHQLSIMLAGEGRSKAETNYRLMSGSCHLDRVSNVEIGVECKYLLLVFYLTGAKFYNLGHIQGIIKRVITLN